MFSLLNIFIGFMKRIVLILILLLYIAMPVFSDSLDIDVEETETTEGEKERPGKRSIYDLPKVSLEDGNLIIETIYPSEVDIVIYNHDKKVFSCVDTLLCCTHSFYVAPVLFSGEFYNLYIRVGEKTYTGLFLCLNK